MFFEGVTLFPVHLAENVPLGGLVLNGELVIHRCPHLFSEVQWTFVSY